MSWAMGLLTIAVPVDVMGDWLGLAVAFQLMSWAIDLGLLNSSRCQIRWQLIGLFVAFPVDVVEDWLGLAVAVPVVKNFGAWTVAASTSPANVIWTKEVVWFPSIADWVLDKAISFCHR